MPGPPCIDCGRPTEPRTIAAEAWAAYDHGRVDLEPSHHHHRCEKCEREWYADRIVFQEWILRQPRRPSRVRKVWPCCHCGQTIPAGTIAYVYSDYGEDAIDRVVTWRFCSETCGR